MDENEVWSTIDEFPNYMVSNLGRVKGVDRVIVKKDGRVTHIKEAIKKQCKTKGHLVTRLSNVVESRCCYVHRFIAIAFIPNPENKPYINHKDGNKNNNSISNLEWCTSSENNQHAIDNGLRSYKKGCSHRLSIFSESEVLKIRQLYNAGIRLSDITKMLNKDRSSISNIAKGISYTNVIFAKPK